MPNAQSDPPVTVHRRLLSRLVRALPIASESQLQAMLNVFDHRANPPAAQNPPPAPPSNIPQAAASNQSRWLALPPAPQSHHPGGISHGRVPTNDPLQHLLPQPSHKRSGLHFPLYNTLPLRPRIPSVMSVYVSSLPRTFSQRWTTAPPSTGARSQNSGAQQFA